MSGSVVEQTPLGSLIEAAMNVVIGFLVALLSQIVVFPLVGIHGLAFTTNLEIGAYFTAISLVRSYVIRRWFNTRLRQAAERLATGASS